MKCPFCGAADTKVVDSRPVKDDSEIRRRRLCEECSKRFTTYEKFESAILMIVKNNNEREPYKRSKLENGIIISCRKRPVSADKIASIVDSIEEEIFSLGKKELASSYIGERVMEKLEKLDKVAYVRFASVYRQFQDIDSFTDEVGKLKEEK